MHAMLQARLQTLALLAPQVLSVTFCYHAACALFPDHAHAQKHNCISCFPDSCLMLTVLSVCRMLFGFSRDQAVPFSSTWQKVDESSGVPHCAGRQSKFTIQLSESDIRYRLHLYCYDGL